MSNDRSRDGLLRFLDYLSTKGLMPKATAEARKAAAGKVLGVLSIDEAQDVIGIDIFDIMRRFSNLHGQKYTPASLSTYQSRVKSAIDDFESYLKNPLGFRPSISSRDRSTKPLISKSESNNVSELTKPPPTRNTTSVSDTILPIPIRVDLTVYIQGLPFDLRRYEAAKISAVIMAMANDE